VAREFRLPDIGEGLTEAEIVRWLVAVGDEVQSDQPIVEVETDKAVVEIPSPFAGVVISLGGDEGDVIEVGEVLVTIGEPGEAPVSWSGRDEPEPVHGERDGPQEPSGRPEPEPIVGTLSSEAETLSPPPEGEATVPRSVKALPVVRKLARDNDVDLETVEGSGPGGRIMREDVESVIAARSRETEEAAKPGVPEHAVHDVAVGAGHGVSDEHLADVAEPAVEGGEERRTMSRLRRTISANMSKSWAEIPHVTTFDDVDATRLLGVRRALGERNETRVPIEALVIKAVVPALDEFPDFNSKLDGDDLIHRPQKDIGIAVDTPDGLIVAVVRDAGQKSVMDLAAEVRRLGEGARERTLAPEELTGQTFTVSNIGAVGGGHGTPIVPYGTVAILSVGMARLQPIVYDEDLAIDGAVGRRFISLVLENLEEPALFLAG
jgi:pyruvate/2-oxoglutarate dehydrogenase complex dihydrolipoamide acyltransferase (E2) component